jgi:hypothetical protein
MDRYLNYWLIGIVSLIALFFLPFVGSAAGLALVLPNTVAGWIVYSGTKIIVAAINVLLFHCFFQQSKVNVKDHPRYVEALEILDRLRVKEQVFRSPEQYTKSSYRNKGTTIFITTILGAFSLTQALLVFDLIMFLTYLFTIIMGLIFGVLNMKSAENYWIGEMWHYAKKKENEAIEAEKAEAERIAEEKRIAAE